METLQPNTTAETLAAVSSQILKDCLKEKNNDLGKVSEEGLNGKMESGDDGSVSVVITRRVVETEVSTEKVLEIKEMAAENVLEDQEMVVLEGGEEIGKGFDSGLGVEKMEENGLQEDGSDDLFVDALQGSLSNENGNDCKSGFEDEIDSRAEIGGDLGEKSTRRVVETEISVEEVKEIKEMAAEKVLEDQEMAVSEGGGKEEIGKGFDSVLGFNKMEENVVQENGSDDIDKQVECKENDISLFVDVLQGSLSNENGNDSKSGVEGEKDSMDEIGGDLGEKSTENDNVEQSDSDGENNDEQDHEFVVGEFVWGKIKSHPWWPGQIYNPSDASDYAAKVKHKGQFLVAYFGDGSFSWCSPSQLMPFVENFEEMSNQSNSKIFVNAAQNSLDEISRLVQREMTCKCVNVEDQKSLEVAMPMNGGIRAGVFAPKGNTVKLLIDQMEPVELLSNLKYAATVVSVTNMLELTVMKSWLTAFYRAKGGFILPIYHEPKCIEGLEDKMRGGIPGKDDISEPEIVPIQGPSEEDWHSSPVSPGSLSNRSSLKKCSESGGVKSYGTRKQKSVAELLDVKPKQKKMDMSKDNGNSSLVTPSSGRKRGSKRKDEEVFKSPGSAENGVVEGDERTDVGNHLSRDRKKQNKVSGEPIEETTKNDTVSRERKKSKYLSPPYTSPKWTARSSNSSKDSQTEIEKIRKRARMGERMTKIAGQLIQASKQDHKESSDDQYMEVIDETLNVNEVVCQLPLIFLDPSYLKDKKNLEMIKGFISAFRDSIFLNGSNYEMYHKHQPGRKRKQESLEMPRNEMDNKDSLILQFPPGMALPTKDDLVKIFSKFGDLNEKETGMLYNSFSARVVFVKSSDAEEAFRASVEKNPFGNAKVTFRLCGLSAAENASNSRKKSLKNVASSKSSVDEELELGFIKGKMEMLNSMVKNCDGKMTAGMKLELDGGLRDVLAKVSLMD